MYPPFGQDIGGQRFGDLPAPTKLPWADAFAQNVRAQRYKEADAHMDKHDL